MSVFNLFYFPGAYVIFGHIKKKKKRMCCSTLRHVVDIKKHNIPAMHPMEFTHPESHKGKFCNQHLPS